MLLAQTYQQQQPPFNRSSLQQLQQQQQAFASSQRQQSRPSSRTQYYPQTLDPEPTLDLSLDTENHIQSISSSPNSTQSLLPQYTLSAFDSIPTIAIPRGLQHSDNYLGNSASENPSFDDISLFSTADMMHPDSWLHASGPLTPKSATRLSHHRESSLSSLGSAGPASPYSHNTSNPQIAVTDSMNDAYNGLPSHDEAFYPMSKTSMDPSGHGTFYTGYSGYAPDTTSAMAYANIIASQKPKADRGLLSHPEFPIGQNKSSRPVSVASSIASDSPATPSMPEPEEDRRRKNVYNHTVPKLDRTLTDVFSDELYNPHFAVTSAPPSQAQLASVSPNSAIFQNRLEAAQKHLSTHSPVSATESRGRSPYTSHSPLMNEHLHDFNTMGQQAQMRFGSAQHLREQGKAEHDMQALRNHDTGTPQTISPKDAMLEFHEADQESNFPLFPQQNNSGFDGDHMNKVVANPTAAHFNGISLDNTAFHHYMPTQMPTNVQVPQQYPFIPGTQQHGSVASMSTPSLSVPSRVGSAESGIADSVGSPIQKPQGTRADGGTYSCTYHGCTQRFETPALLQKHKREGHRQAHGLSGTRKPEAMGMTSTLLNSQAGPHRCDRINPSTGKPCSTVFSRPYDLTRHEDTIHNGRKQKVRCNLCTEEKTFSRADALTRHYRVCHPDVEFPGKHRRRANVGA